MPRLIFSLSAAVCLQACATLAPTAVPPNVTATTAERAETPGSPVACVHGRPEAALPAATLPGPWLDAHGSGLSAYQRTGGVWLKGAPVLVNEAYDFAVAMSLDGIGAGVAAAQRVRNNETKAASIEPITLEASSAAEWQALRDCGVLVYGLLWGTSESAELWVLVDEFAPSDDGALALVHSRALAVGELPVGEQGWNAASILQALNGGTHYLLAAAPNPAAARAAQ